jgi:3-hydroxybutyryl-CoA dehydrogenase
MRDANDANLVLGIVGAGTMGQGIAQIAAAAGIEVLLHDSAEGAAAKGAAALATLFDSLAAKGKLSRDAAQDTIARIKPVAALADLAPCDVVVEAIVELLDVKKALFSALEAVVRADCVLASNTSSLSVSAIAAACKKPQRVAGLHFFNPVALMKIVEIVPGVVTDPKISDFLLALGRRVGHAVALVRDAPGFLVNHVGRGYNTESLRVASEGVASPVDIDRVLTEQAGFRMGPFQLLDLIGLDVTQAVMESLYAQFYQEPRFRPSILPRNMVAAGLLGRKTGRGFFTYIYGKTLLPPEQPAPAARGAKVWISPRDPEAQAALAAIVEKAGGVLDAGATPAPDSICIVTPLGEDCTTAALAEGLEPSRTLAVDPLFGFAGRRVLMSNPATTPESRAALHGLLAAGGHAVTAIHDSPGFVSQRVVASVVNVACDAAQQQIAAPADIDEAVRLGLGYPEGPLSLGDRIGARKIVTVLEKLLSATGDPRYRPSLWLRRRAALGLPLATPEG